MSHDLKLERLLDASPAVVFGDFTGLQAKGNSTPPREPRPLAFQVVDWPRCTVYRSTMTMPDGSSVDTGMEATFPSTMAGPG